MTAPSIGKFITLEGGEGAGKSTAKAFIAAAAAIKALAVDFPAPSPPSSVMNFPMLGAVMVLGSIDSHCGGSADSVSHFDCARSRWR